MKVVFRNIFLLALCLALLTQGALAATTTTQPHPDLQPQPKVKPNIIMAQPSVTITQPTAGATWYTGSSQKISWTFTGAFTASVTLWKDNQQVAFISGDVSTGSTTYTVPWTREPGSYEVRIASADNKVTAKQPVTIAATTLAITSPKQDDNWYPGMTYPIAWKLTGTQTKVDASIWQLATGKTTVIGSDLSGGTSFTVPLDWPGDYYFLSVGTKDSHGPSAKLRVRVLPPTLSVTSPKNGDNWATGSTYPISWQVQGNPGPLKIEMFNSGGSFIVADNVPATAGKYDWKVIGLTNAGYKVRVTAQNLPSLTATSPEVYIKNPYIDIFYNGITPYAYLGKPFTIKWDYFAAGATVDIKIVDAMNGNIVYLDVKNAPIGSNGHGQYVWVPMGPPRTDGNPRYTVMLKSAAGCTDQESFFQYQ